MPDSSSVRAAKEWYVRCPPVKAHDVGGHMVPTVKGAVFGVFKNYKRRITIEILETITDDHHAHRASERIVSSLPNELEEDDKIILRIWKKRSKDDDSSSSDDDDDHDDDDDEQSIDEDGDWFEYRKYDIDAINEVELDKHHWEATLGLAALRERREFKFGSKEEAEHFHKDIEHLRDAVKRRAAKRIESFRSDQKEQATKVQKAAAAVDKVEEENVSRSTSLEPIKPGSDLNLLIQIVSASDLPIADLNSSDPYVNVYLGQKKLHKTKHIQNTLDPVYTLEHDCLFLLECSMEEFFSAAGGLTFVVKDNDHLRSNDSLAQVDIPQKALLAMNGERSEHTLQVLGKLKPPGAIPPKLVIRVRKPEERDVKFMKRFQETGFKTGIFAEAAFLTPHTESAGLFKTESKMENGERRYRTKPTYDPERPKDETKWLTNTMLEEEMIKPSRNWIEAGSGTLGKVYVEVLKCDGLPNLDAGVVGQGKSDAFVSMLFEDTIVNTDVINDCLSPKFMPWATRAFVFNREHGSSQLHLAVLDFDMGDHGKIGRISIDLTNLAADTEYILTYTLYRSVLDNERPEAGTITLRLRMEYDSFRSLTLGSLKLPPSHFVNSNKKSDFKASYFVVNGEENLTQLDMEALRSYQTELMEYGHLLPVIASAIKTVLLWRGHYDLKIAGKKISLPVHSLTAFVLATMLVENYNYFPAFSLFCIAWLLLATNEHRQRHPSPWHRPLTFSEMLYGVVIGKMPKVDIDKFQNEGAIRRHEEAQAEQKKKNEEQAKKAQEQAQKLSEFTTSQPDPGQEDMASPAGGGGLHLNPMSFILLPVQHTLTTVCVSMRVISSFVMWKESIFSFVIVNACIVGGLVLMLVPWGFLVRWLLRIVVWVALGPWMKLVDIYYVRKLEEEGDNDAKRFHQLAKSRVAESTQAKTQLMMVKESIRTMKAMKKYYFGKYAVGCPQFKSFRYADYPRMESEGHYYTAKKNAAVHVSERKYGQSLVGEMIPKWGGEEEAYKTMGKKN